MERKQDGRGIRIQGLSKESIRESETNIKSREYELPAAERSDHWKHGFPDPSARNTSAKS